MDIGQIVIDKHDEGEGKIIDIYTDYNGNPHFGTTVYIVDFGGDRVFDRYIWEMDPVK